MRQASKVTRVLLALLAALGGAPAAARAAEVERASVRSDGAQALHGNSNGCALSHDGSVVAFHSTAQNLVPGQIMLGEDVYVRDRANGVTERVSTAAGGTGGNGASTDPAISADGRWVAFASWATNLVSPATPFGRRHVYLRDRQAGVTSLVSVTAAGVRANGNCSAPAMSADGRYVAFVSVATDLVDPPTNGHAQVFRWDRATGVIELASIDGADAQGGQPSGHPSLDASGALLAFHSQALLDPRGGGQQIYVRDFAAGITELVSLSRTGLTAGNTHSANPVISGDGRAVAFESGATDLLDDDPLGRWHVYVRDRLAGATIRASEVDAGGMANASAYNAAISADGSRVAFETSASNLVPDGNGNVDIFVRKLDSPARTERVSVPDAGLGDPEGDGWSWFATISGDGGTIGFESWCTDLVAGDTNGFADVFVAEAYLPAWLGVDAPGPAGVAALELRPNPVDAGALTEVRFTLRRAGRARVSVMDVQGRLVRVLASGEWPAGAHTARWDSHDASGSPVRAGVYLVRVESGEGRSARRLVVRT